MKITIVGSGYVGLVSGACFAQMGNCVTCFDVDTHKITALNQASIPIYEPGLKEIVQENLNKNLFFTTNPQDAYKDALVIFIAVGTPMGEDGSADLSYVLAVAKQIGAYIDSYCVIVDKSTVPIGTATLVKETISSELKKRKIHIDFDVISNPEFLKEGKAIADFMSPDRIVIGSDSSKATQIMQELYTPFTLKKERFITMDIKSAEMTKYAANAMLATKISFINEMSQICEKVGADINAVRIGIGSDPRIGYDFIYPGIGYGGSCFPKDIQALEKIAKDVKLQPKILQAVQAVNQEQKIHFVHKITQYFGEKLEGKTFAIWGLSFKPETDDMRESPSLFILRSLHQMGAKLQAYDPKAMENAKFYLKDLKNLSYFQDKYLALQDCDALCVLTEWQEFRSPDFTRIASNLKAKIIFDGRNIYTNCDFEKFDLTYRCIGKIDV
ncbi:UDP-glucose 6-dehydrogenase [Helicobacter enhydrae]|uniref:UDP-glucose 6-dehydrogenase n=1 Tax=Helicobacter enhydrae TaxID=222136 RepID=A0A1B1U5M8_9HELI|nr:UDP-glucose/GDP-mannose dehydrogenase family protein [Helicobacter enhydrae]ANV98031.1 UDP-glucose 6-dehydrogenase [Helicobacter enhydrae]